MAHRLFAAHDRAIGGYIASQLAEAAGADSVFLPFCDTDEENLVSRCKGRTLFELDCARLRRITGMIAVLHGPGLDNGVCMEAGFAAAIGVPVVLLTTDFQTYTPLPGGSGSVFADPLLETIAAAVVRAYRLGPADEHTANRYRRFLEQNLATIRTATAQAVTALLGAERQPAPAPHAIPAGSKLAYLEPSPYVADDAWASITWELRARGWRVHAAKRLLTGTGVAEAARVDWAAATSAELAVVDTRGPETPPGAALITGACAAAGRPVLAAHTGTWHTLADGREPNWRNLMIQYAATARFSSIAEFTAALDTLPCMET